MFTKKISISKETFLLAYKLLHDALLLMLATLAAVLIAEGLLPGLVTSKLSMGAIIITIILILSAIAYLGENLNLTYNQIKVNGSRSLPVLILFSFLLIGNSLLKFTFWENIVITLTTLSIFFLFYQLIFTGENE